MSSSSFQVACLDFLNIVHVICKQQQFCFFFSLDSFYFFSSLIPMARTSKTMLNKSGKSEKKSGKSGHACLIPDLTGNAFGFFIIENNVTCGFILCMYILT